MDIVRIRNADYARYEELLLERDRLRKEARIYQGLYMKEFGSLMLEVFERQIACIRKKKQIGYYQRAVNRGEPINPAEVEDTLKQEMAEYQERLRAMAEEGRAAKSLTEISSLALLRIKRIYRRLAKRLHPDLNPKTAETPELMELWHAVQTAYNCNSLEDMEEAEVLVNRALEEIGMGSVEIEIPDLDSKIASVEAEIRDIIQTEPYRYKDLLDDPSAMTEKTRSLEKEKKRFAEYEMELDATLDELLSKGVRILCRMS